MRALLTFGLVSVAFALSGCDTFTWKKKPVATPQQAAPIGQAQTTTDQTVKKADDAQEQVSVKVKQIAGEVRANVQNAREENKLQPAGPHTNSVEGELSLADKKLVTVPVDPTELALGQARREANLQGKSDTYQKLYEQSATKSEDLVKGLTAAQTAKDAAIVERDAARDREKKTVADYQATVEKNATDYKTQWDAEMKRRDTVEKDLKEGIGRTTQLWLTMGCYGLGVICFIFAAVRAYMAFQTGGLGIVSAAKSAGVAIFCGACFFALGRLTSQPWFWYACGAVLVLAVVSVVIVLVVDAHKTRKEMDEKKEIQACTDDVISGVEELRTSSKNPPASMVQAMQKEMGDGTSHEQAVTAIKASLKAVVDPTLQQWVTEGDGVAHYVDTRRRHLELGSTPTA